MASANNSYSAATLNPGDAVKLEPLAANAFLQGKAPSSWEQDKVYIIDCWATWCMPCKTTIPSLNRLYNDYQAKGLRVIGVSVFGEERTNVEAFLKAEGSGMSYPVAIAEKCGAFETEWLNPATVASLPSMPFRTGTGEKLKNRPAEQAVQTHWRLGNCCSQYWARRKRILRPMTKHGVLGT